MSLSTRSISLRFWRFFGLKAGTFGRFLCLISIGPSPIGDGSDKCKTIELEFLRRTKFMAAKLSYNRTLGSHKAGAFVFILAATLFLCSSYVLAADSVRNKSSGTSNGTEMGADSGPPRYRVFSLRHIPAEQGKKYLAEARVGTVSQLPGLNVLLVTAQRGELIKASAILKLVDAKEPFVIKAFFPPWGVKNLPSNEQIAAKVGNISIGTFSEPPALAASFLRGKTAKAAKSKAIIDIHNDAVIAVAPARELEKIITAIGELQKVKAPALQEPKPLL